MLAAGSEHDRLLGDDGNVDHMGFILMLVARNTCCMLRGSITIVVGAIYVWLADICESDSRFSLAMWLCIAGFIDFSLSFISAGITNWLQVLPVEEIRNRMFLWKCTAALVRIVCAFFTNVVLFCYSSCERENAIVLWIYGFLFLIAIFIDVATTRK